MVAVLTGDIVGYTRLESESREGLLKNLKHFITGELDTSLQGRKSKFELVRGDSFQGITTSKDALKAALMIKCYLNTVISQQPYSKYSNAPTKHIPVRFSNNARIAIGIGEVDFEARRLSESDGQAFWYSGRSLDAMKYDKAMLKIVTPFKYVNDELDSSCTLLEVIMLRWTTSQAEAILAKLKGESDQEIAENFGISRQAINARIGTAGWHAVEKLLNRFEQILDYNNLI